MTENGFEVRIAGPAGGPAVVCVNGGQAAEVDGTWSASLEWLVGRVAPRFPGSVRGGAVPDQVVEPLDSCIDDAREAIDRVDAERTLLLGFSMGGAVAISVADDPRVEGVLGLAPWIPDQLSVEPLRGRRLDVLHGSLDRAFPAFPASPHATRAPVSSARRRSAFPAPTTLIRGALHAIALRAGRPVPLPRAHAWERHVAVHLDAFVRARLNVRRACHTPQPISTRTTGEPVTTKTTTKPPTPVARSAHSRHAARAT